MATLSSNDPEFTAFEPIPYHAHSHHARHLIDASHKRILPFLPLPHLRVLEDLQSGRVVNFKAFRRTTKGITPVGILGAGPGGLYAALILDDLGIDYQILEASNRTGGRLFTHHFSNEEFDYYDVGAMRFPNIPLMTRLFNLFRYKPLNEGSDPLYRRLIPFYFTTKPVNEPDRGFLYYNNVRERNVHGTFPGDPFKAAEVIRDVNPTPYINAGVANITEDVFTPFVTWLNDDLKNGTNTGWQKMMKFDKYSTRAYMSLSYQPSPQLGLPAESLSNDVVSWCETFDKSTGWYDRSLTESVLEGMAFGAGEKPDWYCLKGGSQVLSDYMQAYIQQRNPKALVFNQRVTGIYPDGDYMKVAVAGNDQPLTYEDVISTLPLACLRSLDIYSCLTPLQSNALRELDYGPAIKIGIKFKTDWWVTGKDKTGAPINIVGGQSYTDRPIRTVVYPSYSFSGVSQSGVSKPTTVLIASYCWTYDAERLGALIGTGQKQFDQQLLTLTLRDLADIHNVDNEWLRDQIANPETDVFAWDWNHDPLTQGAYAFFGPGKFQSLYESLTVPAGNLYFAGEAVSPRHAWVVGALDSVWQAMHVYLHRHHPEKIPLFYLHWGTSMDWVKPSSEFQPSTEPVKPEDDLLLQHLIIHRPDLFL